METGEKKNLFIMIPGDVEFLGWCNFAMVLRQMLRGKEEDHKPTDRGNVCLRKFLYWIRRESARSKVSQDGMKDGIGRFCVTSGEPQLIGRRYDPRSLKRSGFWGPIN